MNTATWVEKNLTDKTEHPLKAISISATSFCVNDAPYYSLRVDSQNLVDRNAAIEVRWYQANAQGQPINASGQPTTDPAQYVPAYDPATPAATPYVDSHRLTNGAFGIQALWKGAAVDAQGHATAWPGWILKSPGVWKQVDSGGVRPGMFAVVTVNPSAQTAALYPPAASGCADPPASVVVVDDDAAVDNQADGTTSPTAELAATGAADSGSVGFAGLLAILTGGFIVALGRRRREQ